LALNDLRLEKIVIFLIKTANEVLEIPMVLFCFYNRTHVELSHVPSVT